LRRLFMFLDRNALDAMELVSKKMLTFATSNGRSTVKRQVIGTSIVQTDVGHIFYVKRTPFQHYMYCINPTRTEST
ncbi:hypothetical protein PFISCL1PPCAC_8787, partial [Pristionchus fissidentatus]